MADKPATSNWWATLPGLFTAAATFITAFTGLLVGLNQAGIWPVKTQPIKPAVQQDQIVGSVGNDIPTTATELCSSNDDTWGKKPCGSTTVVFQPVYSGNDSAIITTNVGTEPIWIKLVPLCDDAPQCGKPWSHIVQPVTTPDDGSANENLTVNQQGLHHFTWAAYR